MDAKAMILDRYHAHLADGVQRFAPAVRKEGQASEKARGRGLCSACPGALQSAEVSASGLEGGLESRVTLQFPWSPKDVFALADYPTEADEGATRGDPLFMADTAPSRILARLLDKLPGAAGAHRAFAVKCASKKGFLAGEACACAQEILALELAAVAPGCVLCFGGRALEGLREAARHLGAALPVDLGIASEVAWKAPWAQVRVLALPSALELDRFPEWRSGVWERLAFLRAGG